VEANAQTAPDPAAALDAAIAAAESSLQKGDFPAAERHYREALFAGWMLRATLERLENRRPEAREALQIASLLKVERRQDLQALAVGELQMGEASRAVEILTDLARKESTDVETRRLLAKALAATGRVEQAVVELDEARARAPADPEVLYLLGTEYLWLKKVEVAASLFARVVEARPIPQTHVLIGRSYRDAGEYERARAELRAALRQDPKVRRAHYYLAMVFLADATTGPDRLDRAIAEFREELKLAPRDPLTNDQLGLALLEAGRPAEALPALESAVREEPRFIYLYHLGRCQLALDRAAEAAASGRRALELAREQGGSDSELERIHYQLGLALRKLGSEPEAATELAEARRLSAANSSAAASPIPERDAVEPNAASPLSELPRPQRQELKRRVTAGLARSYMNLGIIQARSEHFLEAAELFEKTAAVDPDFPQVQYSLGVAYFSAGQFDKATGPLTRALAANPRHAGLKRMLGMAWLNTQSYEKAAELLGEDPELTTDPSVQFAYGLALVKSDRAAEAQRVFSLLLTRHGDTAELSVLLGKAHAQMGDFDSAIESLQRALRLKADVAEANATLGVIYLKQGRLAEAEKALRAELLGHPADVQSRQNLAVALEMQQRPEEAVPLLRGVLEAKPDFADARYLLGKILLAQGAAPEAVEQLEAAARMAPEDANIHYQLGRAYQKQGRTELAEQEFLTFRQLKDKRRGDTR
jgi:tetratricopeptide (TPR) repeat protein